VRTVLHLVSGDAAQTASIAVTEAEAHRALSQILWWRVRSRATEHSKSGAKLLVFPPPVFEYQTRQTSYGMNQKPSKYSSRSRAEVFGWVRVWADTVTICTRGKVGVPPQSHITKTNKQNRTELQRNIGHRIVRIRRANYDPGDKIRAH